MREKVKTLVQELRDAIVVYAPHLGIPPEINGYGDPKTPTTTARFLADKLDGKVVGYFADENPDAQVGGEEGHTFVLVEDRWLIDLWASENVKGAKRVLDLEEPDDLKLATTLYGPREKWKDGVWHCLGKPKRV